ncbi:MAG: hypothetical protein ACQEUT_14095 [Bacillota bacterium]
MENGPSKKKYKERMVRLFKKRIIDEKKIRRGCYDYSRNVSLKKENPERMLRLLKKRIIKERKPEEDATITEET